MDEFLRLLDPASRPDPYPIFEALLRLDPPARSPLGGWVFASWDDCNALLRHPAASSDQRKSPMAQAMAAARDGSGEGPGPDVVQQPPFLFLDPPDHTRLRGLVQKSFTPRRVEALAPRVEALVAELLDRVERRGEATFDVVADLAYPVPITVISELLGVPPEDEEVFAGWSRSLARALDPLPTVDQAELVEMDQAGQEFAAYFERLIEQRRRQPTGDLLSDLVRAEEDGDRLDEAELITTCILLLVAGHETTVNLVANAVLQVLRHGMLATAATPEGARAVVEETLRFDPPVQMTARLALEDIPVGGRVLEAGQFGLVAIGSANRDPAYIADPGRFDPHRTDGRHLSFGFGIHHCLGAALARIEARLALEGLARRLPHLSLAEDPPPYRPNFILRGPERLLCRA